MAAEQWVTGTRDQQRCCWRSMHGADAEQRPNPSPLLLAAVTQQASQQREWEWSGFARMRRSREQCSSLTCAPTRSPWRRLRPRALLLQYVVDMRRLFAVLDYYYRLYSMPCHARPCAVCCRPAHGTDRCLSSYPDLLPNLQSRVRVGPLDGPRQRGHRSHALARGCGLGGS